MYGYLCLCADDLLGVGSVRGVAEGGARDMLFVGCVDDVAVFGVWGALGGKGCSVGWEDGEKGGGDGREVVGGRDGGHREWREYVEMRGVKG